MGESSQHRAPKGCYLVIGHDQFDHTDYPVGRYISLSRARKAARNQARVANADPSALSDVFFVYDDAGACRLRVTHDDLPPHLRQPSTSVSMPESLPPPRPTYDRLFITLLLVTLVLAALWQAKGYYDAMEITDKAGYAQTRSRFLMERPGKNCDHMSWDRYLWAKSQYEDTLHDLRAPPRLKAEYLRDKLRYYQESAFEGPHEVGLVAEFVRRELAHVPANETVAPDALHDKNKRLYLARMKDELPLREELGGFLLDWRANSAMVVTHEDERHLKRALWLCERIANAERIPSLAFILDNGNGDEVPLDGYEAGAFARMIAEARARQDVKQANTLHQALISYQFMNWAVYFDDVRDSITRYSQFLDEQGLDKPTQARALESRFAAVNPYEYSREYQEYRESTHQFMKTSLARPIAGKPAPTQ